MIVYAWHVHTMLISVFLLFPLNNYRAFNHLLFILSNFVTPLIPPPPPINAEQFVTYLFVLYTIAMCLLSNRWYDTCIKYVHAFNDGFIFLYIKDLLQTTTLFRSWCSIFLFISSAIPSLWTRLVVKDILHRSILVVFLS